MMQIDENAFELAYSSFRGFEGIKGYGDKERVRCAINRYIHAAKPNQPNNRGDGAKDS
jgi:hypothetical protein